MAEAFLDVAVLRVQVEGCAELRSRAGLVPRRRQTVALLQVAARHLLPQHLPRRQVFHVSGKKLDRVGDSLQCFVHLPGLLQLHSPFELLRCRLPVFLGDGGMRLLRGLACGAERQNEHEQPKSHREQQLNDSTLIAFT